MIILKEAAVLTQHIERLNKAGKTIGFVPTMGALHQGHISLIQKARSTCDVTICSIFINPAQFNNPADFEKYPVTIASDISQLLAAGTDVLFLPAVSEMYPTGFDKNEHYDIGSIENVLEGKFRPGHFQGVCKVVHKLLDIVNPATLFLGQKDYQQCLVIQRLIRILGVPIMLQIEETRRDQNGLAMSSRNLRLTESQKAQATGIYKMLLYLKANYNQASQRTLEQYASNYLLHNGFHQVDYVTIADPATLQAVDGIEHPNNPIALIAAYIGDVRLIDNLFLS